MERTTGIVVTLVVATLIAVPNMVSAQEPMSFFVTSSGPGDGANLGGLAGADAHCQSLAAAAGAGNRTWRAYLSQTGAGGRGGRRARGGGRGGAGGRARGLSCGSDVPCIYLSPRSRTDAQSRCAERLQPL